MRLVKNEQEVAVLREAGAICADALTACMRATAPGVMEYQLAGVLEYRYPPKLDESGLLCVQCQLEPPEPLLQFPQEAFRVVAVLEPGDVVVGVAHYDHVSARLLRSLFLGDPQIQYVVQVYVR